MKHKKLVIVALLAVIAGLYLFNKPHKQDPHYYAAVCVVINDMAKPTSTADFMQKMQAVIANENSSYAVDKVAFDAQSAQSAIRRFQEMNEQDKAQAAQGTDACLSKMLPTVR
ncbi:hypothetical protein [Kalamiella sp. sgz302252]|uniref:hypothetical protein n=1 Tax=Pantoea sp. sgz302252 TaxID=3341827 RepID=UPI0036D2AAE1